MHRQLMKLLVAGVVFGGVLGAQALGMLSSETARWLVSRDFLIVAGVLLLALYIGGDSLLAFRQERLKSAKPAPPSAAPGKQFGED